MKKLVAIISAAVSFLLVHPPCFVHAAAITSVDANGEEYVAKGYVPMKAAPNAKQFKASSKIASAKLPKKVDLRGMMTKIEDQGETSSCVANAIAGSYEYWVWRATEQDYDVSRLFLYYNARWRQGEQDKDDGTVIQVAMEGLRDLGACSEAQWPFKKPLLVKKPSRAAYQEAAQFKIKEMAQVPTDLKAWKQALASGYPIVFGCLLFESFDESNQRGGVVPMPSPEDVGRSSHGGHAMCAVGYSDKEQVFIVRNSWGDKWGDQGYCYMPYNYLMNPDFNPGDSWVFIPEFALENPEDTWFEDDKPVTDGGRGVTFVINPYKVEDYKTAKITYWDESFVEYTEAAEADYTECVAYAETEQWESIEDFDYEEVVAVWEEENPGEDSDLYVSYETDEFESDDMEEDASAEDEMDAGDEESDEEIVDDSEMDEGEYAEMENSEDADLEYDEGEMDEGGEGEYDDTEESGEEMVDDGEDVDEGEYSEDEGEEESMVEDEGGDDEAYEDEGGDEGNYEEESGDGGGEEE